MEVSVRQTLPKTVKLPVFSEVKKATRMRNGRLLMKSS